MTIDETLKERDRIMQAIRLAQAHRDFEKCKAFLRELVPVTRVIRDFEEGKYHRQDVRHELAIAALSE